MPRTKAPKKKAVQPQPAPVSAEMEALIEEIEGHRKMILSRMRQEQEKFMNKLRAQLHQTTLSIPPNIANKTIGELMELPADWNGNSTCASILAPATNKTNRTVRRVTRSHSFADDEGYLTTESSNGTSGDRKSRAKERVPQSTRLSRSLSQRSQLKAPGSVLGKYKTPKHQAPPTSYGSVTPKMAPNTPQVLLRRPKQGEVALSMQGSPLFTGAVVTENLANINIPLEDGRMLSIQPQKGLRMSHIPHFDLETRRQLEALRENLNKVCAVGTKRAN